MDFTTHTLLAKGPLAVSTRTIPGQIFLGTMSKKRSRMVSCFRKKSAFLLIIDVHERSNDLQEYFLMALKWLRIQICPIDFF